MKIIKKLVCLIKEADRLVADKICEKLDKAAERLQEFANPTIPGMRELKCFEPPKVKSGIIEIDQTMSMDEVLDKMAGEMAKVGYSFQEARDALAAFVLAITKPEPMSHMANNWRKMHGLPMRRKTLEMRRRKR